MKNVIRILILLIVMLFNLRIPTPTKYSPGDTWNIELNDDYSVECHFVEITSEHLIFTIKKENPNDTYNFAIRGNIPCDYVYVNDEMISPKAIGVIPFSFYDVEEFKEINTIKIPFREGTEEYKKIDIDSSNIFFPEGTKIYIGINITLYKF